MKKLISLVLVVLTIFSVMSLSVSAADKVALCKSGVEHEWYRSETKEATCAREGTYVYKCKNCYLGTKAEKYADPLPHTDDNHNGICDVCSGDSTLDCDCICHKKNEGRESILTPLAIILEFFRMLFGINHYCDCGYHQITR